MVSEDSTVRVKKEIYHIDYIAWYIFIKNQLKMQSVWNLRRKITTNKIRALITIKRAKIDSSIRFFQANILHENRAMQVIWLSI